MCFNVLRINLSTSDEWKRFTACGAHKIQRNFRSWWKRFAAVRPFAPIVLFLSSAPLLASSLSDLDGRFADVHCSSLKFGISGWTPASWDLTSYYLCTTCTDLLFSSFRCLSMRELAALFTQRQSFGGGAMKTRGEAARGTGEEGFCRSFRWLRRQILAFARIIPPATQATGMRVPVKLNTWPVYLGFAFNKWTIKVYFLSYLSTHGDS